MEADHMQLSERPPSYSQSHEPQTIHLPSVPKTELLPLHHERTLPPISALDVEPSSQRPADIDEVTHQSTQWPSSNPLSAYYQPSPSQASPITRATTGMESPIAMDTDGANSDGRSRRAASVLSMDDPDVRIAAEALGDLRADFLSSPPQQHSSLPVSSSNGFHQGRSGAPQPEPLLSLLTTSHPLLGTAIGGSLNAYSASKNYSPRFKSGVEYIERRFTPVVNTVGSVGRVTGVEGGVRWFLGGRRPSHHQPSESENGQNVSNKRRKVGDSNIDVDKFQSRESYAVNRQEFHLHHRERRASQVSTVESLPAYDDYRSPSYEEQALITTQQHSDSPTNPGSTWHSRLVLSTSGLSVAMSEESLRSLKYCLGWLKWANEHIGKVIEALKSVLDQIEGASPIRTAGALANGDSNDDSSRGQLILRSEAERTAMNAKIAELKTDVLKTLKDVVDVVSKYAGGALPENARLLVRRHLTSLPQRFRLASSSANRNAHNGTNGQNGHTVTNGDGEVTEGAHKVMVLAKEGLDMMSQVSGVLDGTIVSAEEWCERLGRKKTAEVDGEDTGMLKESLGTPVSGDVQPVIDPNGNVEMR